MANEQNLKPINSEKMAREYQKRSVESRARNKTTEKKRAFRELFEQMLSENGGVLNGEQVSRKDLITARAIQMLMNDETPNNEFLKAFEIVRDTIGEKPIEKVMLSEVDQSVIDEIEQIVSETE